jgi:putative ABC transport system permease protein
VARSAQPGTLVEAVRRTVEDLDPEMPAFGIQTVPEAVRNAQHNLRLSAQLLGAFALVGLLLAAVGVYGVTTNLVAQRVGEFGIRLALGASPGDLLALVLRHGALLAGSGLLLGLAGAFGLSRYLNSLMPRAAGLDLPALAAVAGILLGVALLACYLPARRAMKVDPLEALRNE